jgi:hypothetical protein
VGQKYEKEKMRKNKNERGKKTKRKGKEEKTGVKRSKLEDS